MKKSQDKSKQKGNKRDQKMQRKKGQPKWKNVVAEIENLRKRIEVEIPPPGVLYYKYKPNEGNEIVKT